MNRSEDVAMVAVDRLVAADSPRSDGVDQSHAQLLAESAVDLPPILVHRPTMRVIDGMHRLAAARLAGREAIAVRFFEGTGEEAFEEAVRANVAHGLPLSLADREAAAERILTGRPYVSDRFVAGVVGLAVGTVCAIRRRVGSDAGRGRLGRDGRVRPVDPAEGRKAASEIVAARPEASLREIAREAGISPATARDVREKMRRGEDPVAPAKRRGAERSTSVVSDLFQAPRGSDGDPRQRLAAIGRDPSLRFSVSGRMLLRWLFARADALDQWSELVDGVPPHSAYLLATVAEECAREWAAFATHLRRNIDAA
jgi:ParB-like chromosome segregation protein Spo0J